ncbi:xylose isomerase domain protein tim barrel : Sugar phosphate isomerase/epimerase OS=Singulisphaera acidiphila (strain ATCC BAA-1392 / DSM 18658 / VKM B-2454 / MOB10) GN=Sinac_4824 PE=4 SV=1: AP_endonuc_2 [Gemmata massiliana]|uniref:Xylose isomerase-like TIM barrel domain-containing protein n=1 Tax=Gemmata massiliana TaxID=1210884 RepID=A0A6P2D693_9BACT|nr:sugar phosphate isomerase/epimerase family protein [Gemmata massiliana]VTR94992.1 xylose isomerase domain protein tim barrel : Sugar phosphate isomerase/epimerase OS=Singulisphaera acidiphila (strain ATCC BAA-1392 / DSM 18658 / VKM B-2454 / MOB10) GN=Sinac_4824 PE=4 SV=1: AP_endonuc_2 [Gemmata massiliana]
MPIPPLMIGVCSWSLQVTNVPELKGFLDKLGINVVQIACGDPHHASWAEGDAMPAAARAAGFQMSGAMLGFPGEDYTSPQTIEKTGGFGDPATRPERLERFKWALARTKELGLTDLMLHAGFIPEVGAPERKAFLDTLTQVADLAKQADVIVAFETGQESATLLRRTLDDLKAPNLKVNFDPANMLLYDKDEPLKVLDLLAPDIRSVHLKDAKRPTVKGSWGEEVPLGTGQTDTKGFVKALQRIGFTGPLCIEREVGTQADRFRDIEHGVRFLRECLAS